ncbi:hypothetical protein [Anditalea andensis]|uniref:Restriction endonuclease n=1 Tax=Anditalea andensis TaxID=1048983 RepID=A0A074LIR7_9BACT|nr:hypothetical protein [Anditalea andensis]KEO73667.1 hypothetical protein EL17_11040 [Anditalea andensis]
MKAGNIKGALLEYIVRGLLKNCGFTNVKADNLFSFEQRGLFFVNGRGAAHDADIIMNPPIQMPFAYPTQLLFECKAYGSVGNLPFVRNALGLRNDLNEFEIVTKDTLLKRQNNRRATYAIDTRTRFLYQVGVASVNDFSSPAVEFAANNKVPLLSLSWFLNEESVQKFNRIDQPWVNGFDPAIIKNLYDFLRDRNGDLYSAAHEEARNFLESDNDIADIIRFSNDVFKYSYVALLETGDMVFLFSSARTENNILNYAYDLSDFSSLRAEIHWASDRPNRWRLNVHNSYRDERAQTEFDFYLPKRIFSRWKEFNLDKSAALDIKQNFFSKIFVFNQRNNPEMPFSIINIDREWLERARQEQVN